MADEEVIKWLKILCVMLQAVETISKQNLDVLSVKKVLCVITP